MGGAASVPTPRPVQSAGKSLVCVAGFKISHHTGLAKKTADAIAAAHPDQYDTWFYFASADEYRAFLNETIKPALTEEQRAAHGEHRTSPFCWIERAGEGGANVLDAKGGGDRFREWAMQTFTDEAADKGIRELAGRDPSLLSDAFFDKDPGTAQK